MRAAAAIAAKPRARELAAPKACSTAKAFSTDWLKSASPVAGAAGDTERGLVRAAASFAVRPPALRLGLRANATPYLHNDLNLPAR